MLQPGGQFVFSAFRLFRYIEGGILKAVRTRRHAALEIRKADHAILMHGAHDFGIMVHTTTYPHLTGQLAEAGFGEEPTVFDRNGERVGADWPGSVEYVHVVATKRVVS